MEVAESRKHRRIKSHSQRQHLPILPYRNQVVALKNMPIHKNRSWNVRKCLSKPAAGGGIQKSKSGPSSIVPLYHRPSYVMSIVHHSIGWS